MACWLVTMIFPPLCMLVPAGPLAIRYNEDVYNSYSEIRTNLHANTQRRGRRNTMPKKRRVAPSVEDLTIFCGFYQKVKDSPHLSLRGIAANIGWSPTA